MMSLCNYVKGMVSLYEASYHVFEGKSIMEEAWKFTSEHLKNLESHDPESKLAMEVKHALDSWSFLCIGGYQDWRPGGSWMYTRGEDVNLFLLESAKLNFNIVHGFYRQ
ncbi:hypothetical protein Ddye_019476 [Dipteronia dyeriana]|uniref:Terpene synthase N-terminal domain-containing protein n=1 Tax=Dipteronia dyeriana TaxID=168575 RepID=A0AAD9WV45_9ROSI|nr:hypothetical protein Ddye_019476 [Dipteronia dyeriana]